MAEHQTPKHLGRASERLSRPLASIEASAPGYAVVTTPTRPSYRYGNVVVLEKPPMPSALRKCAELYRQIAACHSLPHPIAVAWEEHIADSVRSYSVTDLEHPFVLLHDDVLSFDHRSDRVERSDLTLRAIGANDWGLVRDMALSSDGFVLDGTREWLLLERRQLVEAGRGVWWGAWDAQRLVATCGAFADLPLVRLDQLLVAPTSRRQGVGGWLVHAIARRYPGWTVVMEPESDSWRSAMYQRVGYVPVGRTTVLLEDSNPSTKR